MKLTLQLLLLAVLAFQPNARAADAKPQWAKEYDLKAAFVFNFLQFVRWPAPVFPAPDAPFVLGVLGDSPLVASLETIVADEKVRGRSVVIRRLTAPAEVAGCHLVFVPRAVPRPVTGPNILTVGEADEFAERGGVIGMVLVQNRVRLKINRRAAQAAGLTIHSQLLQQAELVGEPITTP